MLHNQNECDLGDLLIGCLGAQILLTRLDFKTDGD